MEVITARASGERRRLATGITHMLTKEGKPTVEILNIPGWRVEGLHATGAKWHLIMAPPPLFPPPSKDIVKIYIFKYTLTFFSSLPFLLSPLLGLSSAAVIESIYFLISPQIE